MMTWYVPSFVPPSRRGGDVDSRSESTSAPTCATPRALSVTDTPETESFTATITAIGLVARHQPIGWVISWLQPTAHANTRTKTARMSPPRDWELSALAARNREYPRGTGAVTWGGTAGLTCDSGATEQRPR